jgi:hypothetical protein
MAINVQKPLDLVFQASWDFDNDVLSASTIQILNGSLVVNDPLNNVRLGDGAGAFRTSGYNNICFGTNALHLLTAGFENIAAGTDAMYQASGAACSQNVGIGHGAMHDAVNCTRCVAKHPSASNVPGLKCFTTSSGM